MWLLTWLLWPVGIVRNIMQRDRSLHRVLQERLTELRSASAENDTQAARSRVANQRHRSETRELKTVLAGTLSRLAE